MNRMPGPEKIVANAEHDVFLHSYLDTLAMVERLHRLLLDVIKDEFERLGIIDINAVQALMVFNIGNNEVTAGELRSRGYYQGSNVSYNLKKLVDAGYMHHEKCSVDRRAVRVRLTERGQRVSGIVSELFHRHARGINASGAITSQYFREVNGTMHLLERYWTDQIRYIY
ncbi:MarR family winged helix-turn-helix transcriptional regulator [Halovulum dunhuangense]